MTGGDRPVPVARLFDYAVEQITTTAGRLWPGESVRLRAHGPSVTSYVHRIWVGEHPMLAKYSFLGSSLVSVLHGAHGGWDEIELAQHRYIHTRDALLAREAEQLYLLNARRQLRVCGVTDYHNGVLFTEAIPTGAPLDELLLAKPQHAAVLLRRAWAPIARVHRSPGDQWPAIPERDIQATFSRTFPGGERGTIDVGPTRPGVNPHAVAKLRHAVRRLHTFPVIRSTTGLVYGGATPENIVVTGAQPVYLDPGMHLAPAAGDLATLVSRVLLMVMSRVSATSARHHILAGLTELIRQEQSQAVIAASAWMVELLSLVARDAANVLGTYLTAPEQLPMPRTALAVLDLADAVVQVVDHLVSGLLHGVDPHEIWARTTDQVVGS